MYSFIAQNLGARKKERVLRTFFHHPGILVFDGTGAWSGIVYIPKTVPFALYE